MKSKIKPANKKKFVGVWVPADIAQKLTSIAKANGRTAAGELRFRIRQLQES